MSSLREKQTLHSVRLSDIQKEVLARVHAAPNEQVAADEILDGGQNYVGAKNILVRLDLINFHDNEASVTDEGEEVMKRANLIDDQGQLTDEGQRYAYDEEDQPQQDQPDQPDQPGQQPQKDQLGTQGGVDQGPSVDQGPISGTGPSFGESFQLIRSIHENYKFNKQLRKFNK